MPTPDGSSRNRVSCAQDISGDASHSAQMTAPGRNRLSGTAVLTGRLSACKPGLNADSYCCPACPGPTDSRPAYIRQYPWQIPVQVPHFTASPPPRNRAPTPRKPPAHPHPDRHFPSANPSRAPGIPRGVPAGPESSGQPPSFTFFSRVLLRAVPCGMLPP